MSIFTSILRWTAEWNLYFRNKSSKSYLPSHHIKLCERWDQSSWIIQPTSLRHSATWVMLQAYQQFDQNTSKKGLTTSDTYVGVMGWPWLESRNPPKPLCHSPPQLDKKRKYKERLMSQDKDRERSLAITVMGKTNSLKLQKWIYY